MVIFEIEKNEKGRELWNGFIKGCFGSFLQSWEWGEVMKADGRKIWRLAVLDDAGKILTAVLLVKHDLPFGKNYLYIPYGPVFSLSPANSSLWQIFLLKIKEIAAAEDSIFLKIEPWIPAGDSIFGDFLKELGFKKSRLNIQPKKTLVLDLLKSHKDLLGEMRSKTRYNIHLARKKGILVRGWPGLSGRGHFDIFWRLMRETAGRDKIRLFPENHYRRVFDILGASDSPGGECELYTAEYVSPEKTNEILASIFTVRHGKTAVYLYGASSNKFRNLMASSLIQWEAILDAKINGCEYYDFWGVDEKKWSGVTRFKKGFGGKEIEYVGSWDYVFRPFWYQIYKLMKKIKF